MIIKKLINRFVKILKYKINTKIY